MPERTRRLDWASLLQRVFPSMKRPPLPRWAAASRFPSWRTVALTLAVVAINGWNRLAVGMRSPVDTGQPMSGGGKLRREQGPSPHA